MTAVDARCNRTMQQEDAEGRRQRRLEGFHPSYRRYVASLTCCSGELEDLADTFPALLFALVSGYGTAESRERAFELVAAPGGRRLGARPLAAPAAGQRVHGSLAHLPARWRLLPAHCQPDPARGTPPARLAVARDPCLGDCGQCLCALARPPARPRGSA